MRIKINKTILREILYFLTALLILFCALEIIWPNSVLSFLNVNVVVVVWLIVWFLAL